MIVERPARFLVQIGQSAAAARGFFTAVPGANRHEFWPDRISFADVDVDVDVDVGGVVVTDRSQMPTLLSSPGAAKGSCTLDSGLAHPHRDIAVLIPMAP